jgi:hypothetical protein
VGDWSTAPMADVSLFNQVFVQRGAVTWPGDWDLAPDAMYIEIKKNSEMDTEIARRLETPKH